ncbi:RNA-directed DNA polymerase from mobile element jockey [Trichonephila clavipes]|nr:RNA-directed DNA polymerase from mobile element jockey [Trichonephila clavipes]
MPFSNGLSPEGVNLRSGTKFCSTNLSFDRSCRYGSQIFGSAGMCHLKKLHTLTNSFLRQIVNAPWFVRNEVIYRDLKIKPFLPHIKNLSKRFFDKLPSVPNELIRNQPAYDPAVPSSQKRPRALLEHEFINFPQAKKASGSNLIFVHWELF